MLKTLDDVDVKGKKVLCRIDINVPFKAGKITDLTRIQRVAKTIKELKNKKAKVILCSHFGRPKGNFNLEYSLAPIVDALSKELGFDVKFAVDCVGIEVERALQNLNNGDVLLLENLRFHAGEQDNDQDFSKKLASYADIYVNDAFSCSHRKHASIYGITKYTPSFAGRLLEEEIQSLSKCLSNSSQRSEQAAIVGGSKVSTKIKLLDSLINKVGLLVIGGGMANTFLKAKGFDVADSLYEDNFLQTANDIIKKANQNNCEIVLPDYVVVANEFKERSPSKIVHIKDMPKKGMILDIAPQAVFKIYGKLTKVKTIIWNGPVGAFETMPFGTGTLALAQLVSSLTQHNNVTSVIGGGDTVSAIKQAALQDQVSYISTAGGAFLEWLEDAELVGIKPLKK